MWRGQTTRSFHDHIIHIRCPRIIHMHIAKGWKIWMKEISVAYTIDKIYVDQSDDTEWVWLGIYEWPFVYLSTNVWGYIYERLFVCSRPYWLCQLKHGVSQLWYLLPSVRKRYAIVCVLGQMGAYGTYKRPFVNLYIVNLRTPIHISRWHNVCVCA